MRSGREDEVLETGLEFTEAGRGAGVGAAAKKSRPRSESAGLVGFGGAGEAFGGSWPLDAGGTELDREGSWGEALSSSKRLTFCRPAGC